MRMYIIYKKYIYCNYTIACRANDAGYSNIHPWVSLVLFGVDTIGSDRTMLQKSCLLQRYDCWTAGTVSNICVIYIYIYCTHRIEVYIYIYIFKYILYCIGRYGQIHGLKQEVLKAPRQRSSFRKEVLATSHPKTSISLQNPDAQGRPNMGGNVTLDDLKC